MSATQRENNGAAKNCRWCEEPVEPGQPHTLCEEAERKQGKLF
jgi:hypothetical protein